MFYFTDFQPPRTKAPEHLMKRSAGLQLLTILYLLVYLFIDLRLWSQIRATYTCKRVEVLQKKIKFCKGK